LLGEAVRAFPEDAEVRYHLGLSQHRLKQVSDSKSNLTKAVALAPESPLAVEAKKLLDEMK
jgi:hypothetical protein